MIDYNNKLHKSLVVRNLKMPFMEIGMRPFYCLFFFDSCLTLTQLDKGVSGLKLIKSSFSITYCSALALLRKTQNAPTLNDPLCQSHQFSHVIPKHMAYVVIFCNELEVTQKTVNCTGPMITSLILLFSSHHQTP